MLSQRKGTWIGVLTAVILATAPPAHGDVITDANAKAAEVASKHPSTPISVRMMAIVQVSVFEAANAITARYPAFRVKVAAAPGASVDAAVAAATRTALLKLMPPQQAAIEADYQAALKSVPGRPREDRRDRRRRAGGDRRPCLVRRGWGDGTQHLSTPYDPRRLRANRLPGRAALGQAQTLGVDERRPVPPRPAAQPDQ